MKIKSAKFITSVVDIKNAPDRKKEILFVGKSNVGKSSLINALCNAKVAYTSKKPGHTKLLNYFLINNDFYFVDSPGYGFSAKKDLDYELYGEMLENYFKDNEYLKLIIFLLDSRHLPTDDDCDFYKYLLAIHYPFYLVMTKADKLNMSEKAKIYRNLKEKFNKDFNQEQVLLVSINDQKSLSLLSEKIEKYIGG